MVPLRDVLRAIGAVVSLQNATTRLVRAFRDTELPPPPPVPLEHGATIYVRGRIDEQHAHERAAVVLDMPPDPIGEPEQPDPEPESAPEPPDRGR